MYRVLLLILSIFCFISCGEIDNKAFTPGEIKLIDSLYNNQLPITRKEQDSICESTHDMRLRHLVDSLKAEEIKQIEAILER